MNVKKSKFFLFFIAAVSRIVKYYHQDGMPLITSGGRSFDFIAKKQSCRDEYFMQVRNGLYSYVAIAKFIIALFEQ